MIREEGMIRLALQLPVLWRRILLRLFLLPSLPVQALQTSVMCGQMFRAANDRERGQDQNKFSSLELRLLAIFGESS